MSDDTSPHGAGPTPPPPGQPQPTWGQAYPPPGHGYPQYVPPRPQHPGATTSMVLGIVAVAGGFACALPFLVAPFAWVKGARTVREIDASGGELGGRGEANAGKVMGIVGTVLLALAIIVTVVVVVIAVAVDETSSSDATSAHSPHGAVAAPEQVAA